MEVTVRRAASEDAAAVAAIHVRTWRAAYRGLMPDHILDGLSIEHRTRFWRGALAAERAPAVFVAVRDEAVVGFCAVATPSRDPDADERTAEIAAMYVDPTVWRTGAGRALIDAAFAHLRCAGWRAATLWVLAENEQARAFYARHGFEPDGAEATEERSGRIEVRLRALLTA